MYTSVDYILYYSCMEYIYLVNYVRIYNFTSLLVPVHHGDSSHYNKVFHVDVIGIGDSSLRH